LIDCNCGACVSQLNAPLQPAVETPVADSPLAQRVRDEGATLFQGFSFENPSLLERRRSCPPRVCSEPVEDCFFDSRLPADFQLSVHRSLSDSARDCPPAHSADDAAPIPSLLLQ
jgi:hypothetical protein